MKTKLLITALSAALLAACGGHSGSSSNSATPDEPTSDSVTSASTATATSAGLSRIATASADEVAYDVAADIGDTWRVILNTKTNTFTIKVLSTQYGLTDRTGTFTATTSGDIATFTGTDFTFRVDKRTQLASGNMKLGAKAASVSGSGYIAGDLSKLAGTYLFVGSSRNASNNDYLGVMKGGFKVKADGTIDVCIDGAFNNAGNCAAFNASETPETGTLTMTKDATTGIIKVTEGSHDFGIAHVHAGDYGPTLIFDHFGLNDDNVMRVGTFFAAKPTKLSTQLDGSFACIQRGADLAAVTVSGNKAKVTELATNETHEEIVTLNKLGHGNASFDLDGVGTFNVAGEADFVNALPVSSSMVVLAPDDADLVLCTRK